MQLSPCEHQHTDKHQRPGNKAVYGNRQPYRTGDADQEAPGAACAPVSFLSEELILVDSRDKPTGYCSKLEAHRGEGRLHRAFSVFVFDLRGRLLVHRRSAHKPLWPGFWTNSCCSHPRRGESLPAAVRRRVREELGVGVNACRVFSFEYKASFDTVGTEHELCHVFLARLIDSQALSPHKQEIADLAWLSVNEVDEWMAKETARETAGAQRGEEASGNRPLTPWFRMEWSRLRGEHGAALAPFLRPYARTSVV